MLPQAEADIAEAARLTLSERHSCVSSCCSKTPQPLRTVWCAPQRLASPCHDGAVWDEADRKRYDRVEFDRAKPRGKIDKLNLRAALT